MSLADALGPAQIAALLVLAQRGAEELWSRRNETALRAQGAVESGGDFYPVVAVSHLAWLASVFFLVPADAAPIWPLAALYLALQGVRLWIIASLGRFWTHHILALPGAAPVTAGPYRFMRHPNYVLVTAEVLLLPAVFGSLALGAIMACIIASVLRYKARLEDAAWAAQSSRMAK